MLLLEHNSLNVNQLTMSVQSWFEMGYMVIGGTLIGYVIFNLGVQRIGASQTSIYLNLTPIVTSLLSVLLYDTHMTWPLLLGLAYVLTDVFLASISTRKRRRAKVQHR